MLGKKTLEIKRIVTVEGGGKRFSVSFMNNFQASVGSCINCIYNCEDYSSFDFISAVDV